MWDIIRWEHSQLFWYSTSVYTCKLQQKLFWKGYYFEDEKTLTLSSPNLRQNLLTN